MARLGLVTSQGQFQASSFWLSAQALPLVIAVTWAARRYGSAGSMKTIRRMVFVLLLAAGAGLVVPPPASWRADKAPGRRVRASVRR